MRVEIEQVNTNPGPGADVCTCFQCMHRGGLTQMTMRALCKMPLLSRTASTNSPSGDTSTPSGYLSADRASSTAASPWAAMLSKRVTLSSKKLKMPLVLHVSTGHLVDKLTLFQRETSDVEPEHLKMLVL